MRHTRLWAEPGTLHVIAGVHDPSPVPASLADPLLAAGYTAPIGNIAGSTGPLAHTFDSQHAVDQP